MNANKYNILVLQYISQFFKLFYFFPPTNNFLNLFIYFASAPPISAELNLQLHCLY